MASNRGVQIGWCASGAPWSLSLSLCNFFPCGTLAPQLFPRPHATVHRRGITTSPRVRAKRQHPSADAEHRQSHGPRSRFLGCPPASHRMLHASTGKRQRNRGASRGGATWGRWRSMQHFHAGSGGAWRAVQRLMHGHAGPHCLGFQQRGHAGPCGELHVQW